jgi:hypothetical protein
MSRPIVAVVDELPPRRCPVLPEELAYVLKVIDKQPGAWCQIGSPDKKGGVRSPLHVKRFRWARALKKTKIEGYEFIVRCNGTMLFGRRSA